MCCYIINKHLAAFFTTFLNTQIPKCTGIMELNISGEGYKGIKLTCVECSLLSLFIAGSWHRYLWYTYCNNIKTYSDSFTRSPFPGVVGKSENETNNWEIVLGNCYLQVLLFGVYFATYFKSYQIIFMPFRIHPLIYFVLLNTSPRNWKAIWSVKFS